MLELLAAFLPKRYPDRFTKDGDVLINHSTGDVWNLADPSLDPLEVSSLLVQVGWPVPFCERACLSTRHSSPAQKRVWSSFA